MSNQVKRVLDAQDEVNINFKVPKVKRDAFKGFCAEQSTDKKTVTMSGMLIAFMDDCIMLGKDFNKKEGK